MKGGNWDNSLSQGFLIFRASESYGQFVKHRLPHTQNFSSSRSKAWLLICISNKFPGDADAAGQGLFALAKSKCGCFIWRAAVLSGAEREQMKGQRSPVRCFQPLTLPLQCTCVRSEVIRATSSNALYQAAPAVSCQTASQAFRPSPSSGWLKETGTGKYL